MIITRKYAQHLVRLGKASLGPRLSPDDNGRIYQAVDRHDIQRVDHYEVD